MKVEIRNVGRDIWFDDYSGGREVAWYHPFRDYISRNWEDHKRDCYWMILK